MADADISRQTKKMLLFVAPENGFWAKIFKNRAPSQNEIADYLDISKGTIPGWKNGRQVDLQTAEDAFATVLRRLKEPTPESPPLTTAEVKEADARLHAFRSDFYNDAASIYATAEHLGMKIQVSLANNRSSYLPSCADISANVFSGWDGGIRLSYVSGRLYAVGAAPHGQR